MLFRRLLYFLLLIVLPVLFTSPGALSSQENELEKANVLNEKVLCPEHPDTAISPNNLTGFYSSLGDYPKAGF